MFFKSKKPENQFINSPVEVVRTLLDDRELHYQFHEEDNVFTLGLSGETVSWRTVIQDVLFEVSHLLNDHALTKDIADILFYVSCKTFDEYFNLINKVNMGETEPFMAMLSMG